MPDDGPPDCTVEYTEAGSDSLTSQDREEFEHKCAKAVYK